MELIGITAAATGTTIFTNSRCAAGTESSQAVETLPTYKGGREVIVQR